MNTAHFFKATLLLTAAILASCSGDGMTNDTTGPQQQPGTQGMTEFAVAGNPVDADGASQTRTSGEYTGSSVKFYWTSGDRLWINDAAAATPLKASTRSSIPAANGKELTAKFWFDGTYTALTYPVRYTGGGNTAGDKVTIKAAQAQQTPNDGSHIGTDGDCGTATATRGADGRYNFTLAHKASYLTFMPYYSKGFASSVKLTQIKVTADQPLAGTFDFDDTGIRTYTVTEASNSITLTLNGGGTDGFEIPTAADYSKNAAIMVVDPNSYTNFTVEYTLHDQVTGVTGTVSKNYGNIACYAGKNKKVAPDLAITDYSDRKYYMWDAQQDYWQGISNYPTVEGQSNPNYAQNSSDPRYYNTTQTVAHSALTVPNINEVFYYAYYGDIHYDTKTLWTFHGHLYNVGVWIKKQQVIYNDLVAAGYTQLTSQAQMKVRFYSSPSHAGVDHRTTLQTFSRGYSTSPISNLSDYFYLPSIGYYYHGKFVMICQLSCYWTSTPANQLACSFRFDNQKVFNHHVFRFSGDAAIPFE